MTRHVKIFHIFLVSIIYSSLLFSAYAELKGLVSDEIYARIESLNNLRPDPSIDVEFVIVIPSYNNEKFCEGNLRSVIHQFSSRPYEIIYLNDCSKDATGALVDKFVKENNVESFVKVIHNETRIGAYGNIYKAVHTYIPDHKVVVVVDGDDQLISDYVLLRLEQEYKNPDTWLTYGRYIRNISGKFGAAREASRAVLEKRAVRDMSRFRFHHLKTFKSALFKKIKREDLLYKGQFWPTSGDCAIMFPMVEMCCPKYPGGVIHCKFISDILYLYNTQNPISDFRARRKLKRKTNHKIRKKPAYEPLEHLIEKED